MFAEDPLVIRQVVAQEWLAPVVELGQWAPGRRAILFQGIWVGSEDFGDVERPVLLDKSDEALWHIAESQLPPSQLRQWRRLIAKHEAGDTLTSDEERMLETLLEAGERLTALKAEAYALLKQRGHSLPQIEQPQERRRRRA